MFTVERKPNVDIIITLWTAELCDRYLLWPLQSAQLTSLTLDTVTGSIVYMKILTGGPLIKKKYIVIRCDCLLGIDWTETCDWQNINQHSRLYVFIIADCNCSLKHNFTKMAKKKSKKKITCSQILKCEYFLWGLDCFIRQYKTFEKVKSLMICWHFGDQMNQENNW